MIPVSRVGCHSRQQKSAPELGKKVQSSKKTNRKALCFARLGDLTKWRAAPICSAPAGSGPSTSFSLLTRGNESQEGGSHLFIGYFHRSPGDRGHAGRVRGDDEENLGSILLDREFLGEARRLRAKGSCTIG